MCSRNFAGTKIIIKFVQNPTLLSFPFSPPPPPQYVFQREVLSRGLGVHWGATRQRLGSSGEHILLSGAMWLCAAPCCAPAVVSHTVSEMLSLRTIRLVMRRNR